MIRALAVEGDDHGTVGGRSGTMNVKRDNFLFHVSFWFNH